MTGADTPARRRGETDDTPAPPRRSASEAAIQSGGGAAAARPAADRCLLTNEWPGSHPPPTARAGGRLTRLLLFKSLAETVFVVALLAVFSYTHFNPRFRGTLDSADANAVAGWVVDESAPASQVEVQLFIDGHFVAQSSADRPRPDVSAAGWAPDAAHGFAFRTPPLPPREAEYEARVYALQRVGDGSRRTLQQIAEPARFRVAPDSRNAGAPANWWEALEGH